MYINIIYIIIYIYIYPVQKCATPSKLRVSNQYIEFIRRVPFFDRAATNATRRARKGKTRWSEKRPSCWFLQMRQVDVFLRHPRSCRSASLQCIIYTFRTWMYICIMLLQYKTTCIKHTYITLGYFRCISLPTNSVQWRLKTGCKTWHVANERLHDLSGKGGVCHLPCWLHTNLEWNWFDIVALISPTCMCYFSGRVSHKKGSTKIPMSMDEFAFSRKPNGF